MSALLFHRQNLLSPFHQGGNNKTTDVIDSHRNIMDDDEKTDTTDPSSLLDDDNNSSISYSCETTRRLLFESIADADENLFQELRRQEFARLDATKHIYLDYTGGGLFPAFLLKWHQQMLLLQDDGRNNNKEDIVLGNPHSFNPSSLKSTENVESTRAAVLHYFNADPNEYICIFTSNASCAIKLVGESYPFEEGSDFLVTQDNHNSVTGIREYAKRHGAIVTHLPLTQNDLRYSTQEVIQYLDGSTMKNPHHNNTSQRNNKMMMMRRNKNKAKTTIKHHNKLFAYPAQSNASGVQHSLEWIQEAQSRGWHVLLDAAAFVPTNRLDLSQVKPDFVPMSFYKMFGYPTGIGALLMKKSVVPIMKRPSFFGGTVWAASSLGDWYVLAPNHERFEEGTVNYLGIPAVKTGLEFIETIGVEQIHNHVTRLTARLQAGLLRLKHSSSSSSSYSSSSTITTSRPDSPRALVHVYGPSNMTCHGGTIFFNVLDKNGTMVNVDVVERFAMEHNVSLRTGCFCNPGVSEKAFHISQEILDAVGGQALLPLLSEKKAAYSHILRTKFGVTFNGGGVRVSVGLASTDDDVDTFLSLMAEVFCDKSVEEMTMKVSYN